MVALNEQFTLKNPSLGSENRVGDFFGEVGQGVGKNRLAIRIGTKGKASYSYETASGRPVWPNRDPIEENWRAGEFNVYAFVRNQAPNSFDYLGLWSMGTGGPGGYKPPTNFYHPPYGPQTPKDAIDQISNTIATTLSNLLDSSEAGCIKCAITCSVVIAVGEVVSDKIKGKIDAELRRAIGLGKKTKYKKTFNGISRKYKVLKKVGKAATPVTTAMTFNEVADCSIDCISNQ